MAAQLSIFPRYRIGDRVQALGLGPCTIECEAAQSPGMYYVRDQKGTLHKRRWDLLAPLSD